MTSLFVTAVLAGAVAAAIAVAPTAGADSPSDGCRGSGCSEPRPASPGQKGGSAKNPLSSDFAADIPTGWKNDAQWAKPRPGGPNPFGSGPRPPVFAMD